MRDVVDVMRDESGEYVCRLTYHDHSGVQGIGFITKQNVDGCCCFDARCLIDHDLIDHGDVADLQIIHGCGSLSRLAASLKWDRADELKESETIVRANMRASKNAGIDLKKSSFFRSLPPMVLSRAMELRGLFMSWASGMIDEDDKERLISDICLLRSLRSMERNGVRVDVERAHSLRDSCDDENEKKIYMRAMGAPDGFVTARYDQSWKKTGRIGVDSGFPVMSIPKGRTRSIFVSRWDDGRIVSFDMNAIDYRQIVSSIGGEFAELYAGADDFHKRTAEIVFGSDAPPRPVIKAASYVNFYGGSLETVAERAGICIDEARDILSKMEAPLAPVAEFRRSLGIEAINHGHVVLPSGRRIVVEPSAHEGKVLGLFAQSCSSEVFREFLVQARKALEPYAAVMCFPVHDELVVDVDAKHSEDAISSVESLGFPIRTKIGRNYEEATG